MSQRNENVSPERLKDMKAAIHNFLSQSNVYDSIRNIVDTYVSENKGVDGASMENPEVIMDILRKRGVLQDLAAQMKNSAVVASQTKPFDLIQGEHYLHVRLEGGRAFVDNESVQSRRYKVFFAAHFGNQRFRSSLYPCVVSPPFEDDFILHLDATAFGAAKNSLLDIPTPLNVAVFREDTFSNTAELLGENTVDWRKVLKSGLLGLTIELCGKNGGVPAGIVELHMELLPSRGGRCSEKDIAEQLERQRVSITAADREFLLYARRWWSEYQSIRASHKQRKVKLFASLSSGRMIPVTHFITPTQCPYGLDSPQDAARFVSLLRTFDSNEYGAFSSLENSEATTWLPLFVFVSQRQGHACNHATLLCSLLLGFGLNAFCGIGAQPNGEMGVFVLTLTGGAQKHSDVTVWNPTTGTCDGVHQQRFCSSIDCLFNHRSFYANAQPTTNTCGMSFDIDNEEYWKPIAPMKLRLVPKMPAAPVQFNGFAVSGDDNSGETERELEIKLRSLIASYRDSFGAITTFDSAVSYTLGQALANYERQTSTGRPEDFSFFEQCIRGVLGQGKTFKAIPVNVSHCSAEGIMTILRASASGKEILETVGHDSRYGLRVKLFRFPETVVSVWVMLSVSYSAGSAPTAAAAAAAGNSTTPADLHAEGVEV